MFLSELKIWNFRKYGSRNFDLSDPHLVVPFTQGLNVLVGENDSGKTAIIDAIKLVLKTHAYEWIRVEDRDFYTGADRFRIELLFKGLAPNEAKNFIEWLGWEGEGDKASPILRLIYQVIKKDERILPADVKAGMDEDGYPLNAEARQYLKSTYLRPLRDAETELIAKRNSRLSQILQEHHLFSGKEKDHELVKKFNDLNKDIKAWFETAGKGKEEIKDRIDEFLRKFISEDKESILTTGRGEIKAVLEKLSLDIIDIHNPGLGSLNRLFMAAELLHLKKDNWNGLRLCLIEELEAHLHPQAQMKVVEALQSEQEVQFILSTHSPNLASKVKLHNLILFNGNNVYPLTEEPSKDQTIKATNNYTELDVGDNKFLERFLDVTKSNLFFSKGVILVEGWSEQLLIPVIASKIGCDLTRNEVSIVNVGSTAYFRYAKIFKRKDDKELNIPVAVVTDLDIRPDDEGNFNTDDEAQKKSELKEINGQSVCMFFSRQWTLEWCLYKSNLQSEFGKIVKGVHSGTQGYNDDFKKEIIKHLKNSSLKKVEIAARLAQKISEDDIMLDTSDEWLCYLIEAIKYACGKTKCDGQN
ncbi:MAG: ATP-dependent endonuclease [Bacteroidota bacterium]